MRGMYTRFRAPATGRGTFPRSPGRAGDRPAGPLSLPPALPPEGPPAVLSAAVLAAIARLYALLAAGWVARRGLGERGERLAAALTRVVTDLTMPALIVSTLLARPLELAFAGAVVAGFAGLAAAFALAWVVGAWAAPEPRRRGAFTLAATFCNTGFLGIPLAGALWGPGSLGLSTAVMVDAFTTTILLNSVGVAVAMRFGGATGGFDLRALGRLLRAPMFLAVPVGLALQLAAVPVPDPVREALGWVGAPTGALVFLATGMRLRFGAVRSQLRAIGAVLGIRFVVSPAAALAAAVGLGLTGEVGAQAVLEVAMPTALMAPVIAARYGCDPELGPGAVAVSTAVAPIALMAWLAVTAAALG